MPQSFVQQNTHTPSKAGVLAAFLLALSLLPGCQFWRNFSSYFNALYLAEQHLEKYEADLLKPMPVATGAQAATQRRWLDEEYESRRIQQRMGQRVKITPSFSRAKGGALARGSANTTHLDSAIILGSKVLAKKDVKYIEDALLIIGKAQFYKNDYAGAQRKFMELLTRFPETEHAAEVQTFLARATIGSNKLDTAEVALKTALKLSKESGDRETIANAQRAYAEYLYARSPDTLAAISEALRLAEENLDGHEAAKLAYESGIIYYLDGRWAEAEAAFRRAVEKGEDDAFIGEAKIAHALALRRQQRFDEARVLLSDVAQRAIYLTSQPAARVELAYLEELRARAAVNNDLKGSAFRSNEFPKVTSAYLVVDTTYRTESQAIVSRSKFRQAEFYREMGEYDSAGKVALLLIGTKDFSTPTYNEYVSEKMRSLARFSQWKQELASTDTLLQFLKKARTGVDPNKLSDVFLREQALRDVLKDRYRPDGRTDLDAVDSIKIAERMKQIRAERGLTGPSITITDTSKFLDSVHFRRANAYYELGRAYENFSEIPDARSHYVQALSYRYIVPDTGKEAFKAQVIYAWMQLEHREKNLAVRDSLLEVLTKRYGQTIYAEQAQNLFGADRDPNSPGELAYRAAYAQLRSQGLEGAKQTLNEVARTYSSEDVAPRSLYAIGLGYEDQLRYDSAVAYYRQILEQYPYSVYAESIRPRMADAGMKRPPRQTARRVESNEPKSAAEREREELERARKAREEELLRQQQETPNPFQPSSPKEEPVPDAPLEPSFEEPKPNPID